MDYIIETPCGKIQGCQGRHEHSIAFKGIRYAYASRFEYPTLITKWDGIYDATQYGHCSYQPRAFYNEEDVKEKAFYYNEFRKGETYTYSEDCLFLNIWVNKDVKCDDHLPVLIYIHGGGYSGGCGHEKHFDNPLWVNHGVIGVTINYRLGPLGFACLKELHDEAGHSGNYGLYDQMTAIQWVKNNIEAFGGDPNNISIMGQSAGAMSVQHHCLSPLTHNLFNKAIMSSGGGVSKFFQSKKEEETYAFWNEVKERCGCANLEEFKNVDVKVLFENWQKLKKEKKAGMIASPVIDSHFILQQPYAAFKQGQAKEISYMLGATSEDIFPVAIFPMARHYASSQVKDSYTYFFNRALPGDQNGAWHSSDLWYWFGTLDNCWRPFEEKDYALSDEMVKYLCQFVRCGNPNHQDMVYWKPSSTNHKEVLVIGEEKTKMNKVSSLQLFITSITNKAVGE